MDRNKRMEIAEIVGKTGIFILYGFLSYSLLVNFLVAGKLSSLFFLVFTVIVIFFVLLRPVPKETSMSVHDWTIAMLGTLLPVFFRPAVEAADIRLFQLVQLAGIVVAVTGLLALNKSFGLVAANRGVKTSGLYRFIRHPIYMGYFVSYAAFWVQNVTVKNTVILVGWIVFEILRIFAEEQFLSKDPAYAEYMKRVRWRILPGVF